MSKILHGVDLDKFVRFDRAMTKNPKKAVPQREPVDEAETKKLRVQAFCKAIDLLGPFPWKIPKGETHRFDISSGWFGEFDRDAAWEFCEDIIHSYRGRVNAENSSGRPHSMLTHLREIIGDKEREHLTQSRGGVIRATRAEAQVIEAQHID